MSGFENPNDPQSAESLELLIAAQARVISEQQVKIEHLESLAYTDPLTGLLNRHGIADKFDDFKTNGAPYGAIVGDLYNLGDVNDKKGGSYIAGDNYILAFTSHFKRVLKNYTGSGLDTDNIAIGRYGGDEFIAIIAMPNIETRLPEIAQLVSSSFVEQPDVVELQRTAPVGVQLGARVGSAIATLADELAELMERANPDKSKTAGQYLAGLVSKVPFGGAVGDAVSSGLRVSQMGRDTLRAALDRNDTETD